MGNAFVETRVNLRAKKTGEPSRALPSPHAVVMRDLNTRSFRNPGESPPRFFTLVAGASAAGPGLLGAALPRVVFAVSLVFVTTRDRLGRVDGIGGEPI